MDQNDEYHLPTKEREIYEKNRVTFESDKDFKLDLHKMKSESSHMSDFSTYNLDNIESKEAARA